MYQIIYMREGALEFVEYLKNKNVDLCGKCGACEGNGEVKSSDEGKVYWVSLDEIDKLIKLYNEGVLGGENMPEQENPALDISGI